MSRTVLVTLLTTAAFGCVEQPESPALGEVESEIVGGTDVVPGRWPDTVAVLGRRGTCTGTLIAPDVVLTAGHCAGIEPVTVIADTIDYASSGGTRAGVTRTEAHANWDTTYDVAIVMLDRPITAVAPRRVGTTCTFNAFRPETDVWLVGFGATDMEGKVGNTHLKEAMTAVLDPTCSGGRGCNASVAPGGEFVAGGTGSADSCFGDSGGPVYLDTPTGPIVVGAVSRGVAGAETPCGGGGIYVRTDKIVPWLEATSGRTIAKDDCTGTFDGEIPEGADVDDNGDMLSGCAATRGAGTAGLGLSLVALALVLRRRRR